MIEEINKLVQQQQELAKRAFKEYLPIVEDIIATQTKDINQISFTLDYMLDFCFDEQMLLLYRKLCRYLYDIDQGVAVSYVNAYRETWDEESEKLKTKSEKMKELEI